MSDETPREPTGRAFQLALFVIAGVSMVGFVVGTRNTAPADATPLVPPRTVADAKARPAPTQRELRERPHVAPSTWDTTKDWLATHATPAPAPSRDAALAARRERRAYDGAPPVVPHPIEQRAFSDCLACHATGQPVGTKVASVPSHGPLANCVQCHASATGAAVFDDVLRRDAFTASGTYGSNAFAGAGSPGRGERAWAIAPPTIPHPTFMRETCLSCHGDAGSAPLRTPHLDRQNCRQCHATGAEFDPASRPTP